MKTTPKALRISKALAAELAEAELAFLLEAWQARNPKAYMWGHTVRVKTQEERNSETRTFSADLLALCERMLIEELTAAEYATIAAQGTEQWQAAAPARTAKDKAERKTAAARRAARTAA